MSFLYQDKIAPGVNAPIITPNSPEGIERAKWDRPKSQGGYNRDGYEEYPSVMYKAGRPNMANVAITGSRTVHSDAERLIARGQGWSDTQEAAIAAVHAAHVEHGKLEAERAFQTMRMSEKAQRDAAAREPETVQHVPDLPAVPVKKRGRPARIAQVS